MSALSRGDLGFIPNVRMRMPDRLLMGTPGNLSKKGISKMPDSYLPKNNTPSTSAEQRGQVAAMDGSKPVEATKTATGSKAMEITNDGIADKRIEYLEAQERRHRESVETYKAEISKLEGRIADYEAASQQLFTDTQFVYGHAVRDVRGAIDTDGRHYEVLDLMRKGEKEIDENLCSEGKWIVLYHPIECIEVSDKKMHVMRTRTVDSATGKMYAAWALVHESDDNSETRYIDRFAIHPE